MKKENVVELDKGRVILFSMIVILGILAVIIPKYYFIGFNRGDAVILIYNRRNYEGFEIIKNDEGLEIWEIAGMAHKKSKILLSKKILLK